MTRTSPGPTVLRPRAAHRLAVAYLFTQGTLVMVWWALLLWVPECRTFFKPQAFPDDALLAFWLADLGCVAAGSWLAGGLLLKAPKRAADVTAFTAGALTFATLYCANVTAMTGEAPLATVLMAPAAAATLWIARSLRVGVLGYA